MAKKTPPEARKKTLPCGRQVCPSSPRMKDEQLDRLRERLKHYLEKSGLKFSEQRWNIAKFIIERGGHYNAQEMIKEILRSAPGMGVSTVYRNIKVLCDAHILKETLMDGEGHLVYEAFEEAHHDHIVCLDCGEVFEFHDPEIETLQERVCRKSQFTPVRHKHVIYARCDRLSGGRHRTD